MPAVTGWPDSVSGEWVVASLGDSPVVAGTRLTMVKTASDVGGYGGCNWFGIVRDSTRTLIQSTAIGCPSPISDQESRFTKQLTRAAFSITRGDTLQLLDSARNELMTLVKRQPTRASATQLVGITWLLADASSLTLNWPGVTLSFGPDGISGFGGCRKLSGAYMASGDRLKFTHLAIGTTECTDRRLAVFEDNLTTAYSETEHFDVRGDTLELTTYGGDTLWFVSSPRARETGSSR